MKKLILLLCLIMASLNSYGEWTSVLPGNNASLYIDFNTLEERDEYIYWWYLDSWSKGSEKTYAQGDCNLKGFKINKRVSYSLPMAQGEAIEKNITSSTWEYYQPNTGFEILLNFICQMAKLTPKERENRIDELNKRNKETEINDLTKDSKVKSTPELEALKSPYIMSVEARIKSFWSFQDAKDNWSCDVLINQAENGAVEGVKILGCDIGNNENPAMSKSKAQAFATSIRRSVFKSSPLPLPKNKEVFDKEIIFKFSPI